MIVLDRNISAFQATLEKCPKVFHAVSMDMSPDILFLRVVGRVVCIVITQTFIRSKFVSHNFGARLNTFPYLILQGASFAVWHNTGNHFALTFKHSHDDGFTDSPASLNLLGLFILVHVLRQATDERLIRFYLTGKLLKGSALHRQSDPVKQKPCALLSDLDSSVNLIRTDTILGIDDHPHGGEPFIKSYRAVFHDGSELDREHLFASFALPSSARRNK